jgi:hypothetical protein
MSDKQTNNNDFAAPIQPGVGTAVTPANEREFAAKIAREYSDAAIEARVKALKDGKRA